MGYDCITLFVASWGFAGGDTFVNEREAKMMLGLRGFEGECSGTECRCF